MRRRTSYQNPSSLTIVQGLIHRVELNFVVYRGEFLAERLCVIHIIDHQYYLCMYVPDGTEKSLMCCY